MANDTGGEGLSAPHDRGVGCLLRAVLTVSSPAGAALLLAALPAAAEPAPLPLRSGDLVRVCTHGDRSWIQGRFVSLAGDTLVMHGLRGRPIQLRREGTTWAYHRLGVPLGSIAALERRERRDDLLTGTVLACLVGTGGYVAGQFTGGIIETRMEGHASEWPVESRPSAGAYVRTATAVLATGTASSAALCALLPENDGGGSGRRFLRVLPAAVYGSTIGWFLSYTPMCPPPLWLVLPSLGATAAGRLMLAFSDGLGAEAWRPVPLPLQTRSVVGPDRCAGLIVRLALW